MSESDTRLAKIETILDIQTDILGDIKTCLQGNGQPGLVKDVDRLKQSDKQRKWLTGVLFVVVLSQAATMIGMFIKNSG